MADRPVPASLWWLALLVALSVAAAVGAGATLYLQTRATSRATAAALTGGDVTAGRRAIVRYGCGSCHDIPGIGGASGQVGPALSGVATRAHLAGDFANDPATMTRWLIHPQHLRPGSGMPEQGVSPRDARDVAAYLYTLD